MLNDGSLVLMVWFIMFGPQSGKQEAAMATYKASGTERMLQDYSNNKFSPGVREAFGNSFVIVNGITNHYLTYTWRF